ncbi:unnamed protein product [Nyctereutes procyonoides]|uniref:(raccoon dog) hypothetical protein n=1 Tax=Nyctereutes procyonoides TaxID=34880 RepID=A0A811Z8S1_NYCPR|nr:unnamed protein product [Nyctereutes procyonoides]
MPLWAVVLLRVTTVPLRGGHRTQAQTPHPLAGRVYLLRANSWDASTSRPAGSAAAAAATAAATAAAAATTAAATAAAATAAAAAATTAAATATTSGAWGTEFLKMLFNSLKN